MELKDLVKYYVPMRMEGSSPPNWEVVFGYDISKFKGYNVDEVRVALNLTQLWLSQGPRGGARARPDECPYLRRRTKRFWPPRITLSFNHHTPNSRPSRCNIHSHNQPAYGRGHRLYWHASLPRLWYGPTYHCAP